MPTKRRPRSAGCHRLHKGFDGLVRVLREAGMAVCVPKTTRMVTPRRPVPRQLGELPPGQPRGPLPDVCREPPPGRANLLMRLSADHNRRLEIVDFTEFEEHNVFLEPEQPHPRSHPHVACPRSARTDEQARTTSVSLVLTSSFTACQTSGDAIYHTNVMLAIGTEWAILCDDIIADVAERTAVLDA